VIWTMAMPTTRTITTRRQQRQSQTATTTSAATAADVDDSNNGGQTIADGHDGSRRPRKQTADDGLRHGGITATADSCKCGAAASGWWQWRWWRCYCSCCCHPGMSSASNYSRCAGANWGERGKR
jgi:hypothetical protein